MIFSLHFTKAIALVFSILFLILFLILIYHPPFIYFFFGLILGSQECIRSTISFRLDSGNAGGDDGLRAQNGTWELATLPPWKKVIGCKWVYTIKLNPDGSLARLKARLTIKRYSQVYRLDYVDTFPLIAKMTYVWVFVSLAATYHWPLHQLDIKNVFLNGILDGVYMEQPPVFVA